MKGFAYETSEKAKETADNLGFTDSGANSDIQYYLVNQYGQWPISDSGCVLSSSANFQVSEIYNPDESTETYGEYRSRYLNEAKFYCIDSTGNKIKIDFDDFAPDEYK